MSSGCFYGPVCLDAAWRGKGVLKRLYAAVKAHTSHDYDVGALFIDDDNPHSLAAHVQGLGMTALSPSIVGRAISWWCSPPAEQVYS